MGIWRTLQPRRILHAPGAISVHGGVSPGKPRTRALQSGAEDSTDWAPAALGFLEDLGSLKLENCKCCANSTLTPCTSPNLINDIMRYHQ